MFRQIYRNNHTHRWLNSKRILVLLTDSNEPWGIRGKYEQVTGYEKIKQQLAFLHLSASISLM